MIGLEDVIKAISILLKKETNHPVYSKNTQEGFSKPSFFIEIANDTDGKIASGLYSDNLAIRITYIAIDKKQTKDVFKMRGTLKKLFVDGFAVNEDFYVNLTEDISFTITSDNNLECLIEFKLVQFGPNEIGEDIEDLEMTIWKG